MTVRIIVVGAGGRMGKNLVRAIEAQSNMQLVGATERQSSSLLGADAGEIADAGTLGVPIHADLSSADEADVLLDFTAPEATIRHARFVADRKMRMVIGTTGFSPEQLAQLRSTLAGRAVLMASNYSVGINLALELARKSAAVLAADYDAEITEAHHHHKVDAPSGTALCLGKAVADGRNVQLDDVAVYARQGFTGPRKQGTIGFSVIRAGDIVGEHSLMFAGIGERLEIRHVATDRMTFANGAVRGARWLMNQTSGWYDMRNVLNLS